MMLVGCVKDLEQVGIHTTTRYKGRVVEKNENILIPVEGVTVSVSDGTYVQASSITDSHGKFEMEVDFDNLNSSYALHLDCPHYPSKTEVLKGIGSAEYDYRDILFFDKNSPENLPVVVTSNCSNYELTSVTAGGSVISDNGWPVTARGVCWGTAPNPKADGNHTIEGSGLGSFSSLVTGINFSNATYYIRAYATNECGTGYGEEIVLKRNNPLNYPQFVIDGATYIVHPYIDDADWNTAMSSCNNLVNVFSDWYLPSMQEMEVLMEKNG